MGPSGIDGQATKNTSSSSNNNGNIELGGAGVGLPNNHRVLLNTVENRIITESGGVSGWERWRWPNFKKARYIIAFADVFKLKLQWVPSKCANFGKG